MPKLYYTPASYGAASFISAYVAGVRLEMEEVDLALLTRLPLGLTSTPSTRRELCQRSRVG
eukprot:scaffold659_cov192-Ochromonas_danica.AAC.56